MADRPLKVVTNSFKVESLPTNKKYYQYDAFDVERLPAPRRIQAFERLQNHTEPALFTPKVIYDGKSIAYSSRVLAFGSVRSFEVDMSDRPPSKNCFTITLKRVDAAVIDFSDLQQFIQGQLKQQTPKVIVAINLLQLIVRQAPNLKYPNNIRAFFAKEAGKRKLGGGLDIWKGFYQSVRPALGQLLVNVDLTSGIMYQEGRLVDVALSALDQSNIRALKLDESSPSFRKLKSFFKNVFIGFSHLKNRRKKIQNLIPAAGFHEFQKEPGMEMTVQQYYRDTYNIHIQYPEIIGVVLNRGTVIPAELCVVLPDQRYTRKLPQEYTKGMVEFTSEKPQARMDAILRGIGQAQTQSVLDYQNSPFVQEAGLQIAKAPSVIEGHILSTPAIQYSKQHPPVRPQNGGWNAVRQMFHAPSKITTWAVVDYSLNKQRARQSTERFVEMLVGCCRQLGMDVSPPGVYKMGSHDVNTDLKNAGMEARKEGPPDFLLIILPASAADIRTAVKRFGDVVWGIPTQCVREDKIAKANNQYCNNVAMKINAKLGGINAVPQGGTLAKLRSKPFMILGVDVGHPAPGVFDHPSVASLVYSYDLTGTLYNSITTVQPPRVEAVENLGPMVVEALRRFVVLHKVVPEHLVLFRDGLSEGEYTRAAEMEIQGMLDALGALWAKQRESRPLPKLTYIVVGKKHHVRFFPAKPNEGDRSGNCPAGFVADKGIGNPVAQDFYLQSHGGLLGTSRPSHYIVLRDDNFSWDLSALQDLAFTLCHAYARATRSVSIPAPVYYADIVCGRANFHFKEALRYDESAVSSVSGDAPFNLKRWADGFADTNKRLWNKMYFM